MGELSSKSIDNTTVTALDESTVLTLADGSGWHIIDRGNLASAIIVHLKETMQLTTQGWPTQKVYIDVEENSSVVIGRIMKDDKSITCVFEPSENRYVLSIQAMHVALAIGIDAESRGGILLHGALAERKGCGVILAGPGTVGKTTASQRLPRPWRSLCDDTTLVVRDEHGQYWAHPWPTWSRFFLGGSGGSWKVQHAVPLKSIFFLSQSTQDRIESIGTGQAAALLLEAAEQVFAVMSRYMEYDELQTHRLQRFENICALVKDVPCHALHLSLTGNFWHEIERTLNDNKNPT